MTKSQLESIGVQMDTWMTMEGFANSIPLQDDVVIFLGAKSRQVYFSSDGYLLIRKTKPYPVLDTNNLSEDDLPDGHVFVSHAGYKYIIPLEPGYSDCGVGPYHELIAFDTITCINNTLIK